MVASTSKVRELIKESWSQPAMVVDAVKNICIKFRRLRKSLAKWERRYLQDGQASKDVVLQKIENLEKKRIS